LAPDWAGRRSPCALHVGYVIEGLKPMPPNGGAAANAPNTQPFSDVEDPGYTYLVMPCALSQADPVTPPPAVAAQ